MIISIPLLICLIGAILFYFSQNGKVARFGEVMFEVGLLVTLLRVAVFAGVNWFK